MSYSDLYQVRGYHLPFKNLLQFSAKTRQHLSFAFVLQQFPPSGKPPSLFCACPLTPYLFIITSFECSLCALPWLYKTEWITGPLAPLLFLVHNSSIVCVISSSTCLLLWLFPLLDNKPLHPRQTKNPLSHTNSSALNNSEALYVLVINHYMFWFPSFPSRLYAPWGQDQYLFYSLL